MNESIAKAIIGNMLKRARIENKLVQREMAVEVGLANPNYLSMIEKGTNFDGVAVVVARGRCRRWLAAG